MMDHIENDRSFTVSEEVLTNMKLGLSDLIEEATDPFEKQELLREVEALDQNIRTVQYYGSVIRS
jgi:hypothetical protein